MGTPCGPVAATDPIDQVIADQALLDIQSFAKLRALGVTIWFVVGLFGVLIDDPMLAASAPWVGGYMVIAYAVAFVYARSERIARANPSGWFIHCLSFRQGGR